MRETIIDGQPLFVFEKMESSIEKASGEGAGRHSQEDSTSKRTSRKKAQGQSRRRLGE